MPSGLSTDEEFLRRAYLDVIGVPPTPEEYQKFMGRQGQTRQRWSTPCLQRDEFADLWAAKWAEILKVVSDNNSAFGTDRKAAYAYYSWIREQMHKDTPLDQFVRAQIAATGSNMRNPAVNLYTMMPQGQYDAKAVASNVAQVFTGIRIQCAQCHNHPFDRWTQDDFYGFVSFFTGVKRKELPRRASSTCTTIPTPRRPSTCSTVIPCPPKFLGGAEPDVKGKDPRVALADWLTSKDNTIFRQNMANRIWAHFFGRGIVDPVDDVRISNPPSNRNCWRSWASDWRPTTST